MFCPKCGANMPDEATFCTQCGESLAAEQPQPEVNEIPAQGNGMTDDEATAKRIRDNAKLCAILWIVVGALQCITCVGVVAGAWNIVIGVRGLKACESIVPGNYAVYTAYDNSMTNLIIGAVINFVFGLLVGCALSAFEFYIRDQVLKNRKVFGA